MHEMLSSWRWTLQKEIENPVTSVQLSDQANGEDIKLLRPGLDKTRLFISLTAGAGTRCMSLLSSSPILGPAPWRGRRTVDQRNLVSAVFIVERREIGSWWAAAKKKHLAASNEQETSFILFLAEDSVNCGKKIGPLARNCRRTLLTQLAYRF